jgi:DNA-binding NtrC family response regulator
MNVQTSMPVVKSEPKVGSTVSAQRKRVIVFSPDADLARCLLLILEDEFDIVRKTTIADFESSIRAVAPDLILIDLYTFSADIVKQLDVVRHLSAKVPVIVLRAYLSLTKKMDQAIEDVASLVFYKPVDVDLITQAIEDLLK